MLTRIAERMADSLARNSIIDESEKELYVYAVYTLVSQVFPLILVMITGALMGKIMEGILFIIPFLCIRKFSGGFHAKHMHTCIFSSCIICTICIYLTGVIRYGIMITAAMIAASFSLVLFSPVENENRKLEEDERSRYKKITAVLAVLFLVIYMLCAVLKLYRIAVCIAVGIIMSAMLQLPCAAEKVRTVALKRQKKRG